MKFRSVNELETFNFQDCVIKRLELEQDRVVIDVEALIVGGNNSQNKQFFASYLGETRIVLEGASVKKMILAGSRTYDAEGNLKSEEPDRVLSVPEYDAAVLECRDAYLPSMEKTGEKDGRKEVRMELEIPSPEEYDFLGIHFYVMNVEYDDAVVSWDRYMNRV